MATHSGTGFGPGYSSRTRQQCGSARGASIAWIISLVAHGLLLTGMGLGFWWSGEAAVGGGSLRSDVTLIASWGGRHEKATPSVVSFTTTSNRAPELLELVRQPIF